MSCSVVKDVEIQETRAGMERARKKQGHLKTLGRLVLYAPTPHPLDGLLQWTVRPLTDVDNLPVFLDPLARLTTTQRCTNVALSIRGHRPHLFNVFARVEGDVSTDDAKNAFMPAMQHFSTLVQQGADERKAYKETVGAYHEAIFHGYDLPARGHKFQLMYTVNGNDPAEMSATDSEAEIDALDENENLAEESSDLVFDVGPDGVLFVDMPFKKVNELSVGEYAHVRGIGAKVGKQPGTGTPRKKAGGGGAGSRGGKAKAKGTKPTRSSPRKRVHQGGATASGAPAATGGSGGGGEEPNKGQPKKLPDDKQSTEEEKEKDPDDDDFVVPRATRSAARRRISEALREQDEEDKAAGTQDIPGAGDDEVQDKDYAPTGEEELAAAEEESTDLSSIPVVFASDESANLYGPSTSGSGSPKGTSPSKRRRTNSPPAPIPPAAPTATPTPGGSGGGPVPSTSKQAGASKGTAKEREPSPDNPNEFMPAKGTPGPSKKQRRILTPGEQCVIGQCDHPNMNRTELLACVTDPNAHAAMCYQEQMCRAILAKVSKLSKEVADLKKGQANQEELEREHLEYSKTAATFRQQTEQIKADKGRLGLKWCGPQQCLNVMRDPERLEELKNYLYIGAPQNKNSFLSQLLKEMLDHNYHAHIYLDLKPGDYDFTLGERYLAIPKEFTDLLEAHLQIPAINVKKNDAHSKVSNHFNDIRKLSMKIQRHRLYYYERVDMVCQLLLIEDKEKLNVVKEEAPVHPEAQGKAEWIAKWKPLIEAKYEAKEGKALDYTLRSVENGGKLMNDMKMYVEKQKAKAAALGMDVSLMQHTYPKRNL